MNNKRFRDLAVGDQFDFVDPHRLTHSFTARCVKLSARIYRVTETDGSVWRYRVGSINCAVFNVVPPTQH
jgi:hypothetical protein